MDGIDIGSIDLSDDEIFILGRPNFACNQIADVLINSGRYKNKTHKAEYKQAVFIHWAQKLREKYGSYWRIFAGDTLKKCEQEIKSKIETHKTKEKT